MGVFIYIPFTPFFLVPSNMNAVFVGAGVTLVNTGAGKGGHAPRDYFLGYDGGVV